MKDGWGRKIIYLRLPVTGRCPYHCGYCVPENPASRRGSLSLCWRGIPRAAPASTAVYQRWRVGTAAGALWRAPALSAAFLLAVNLLKIRKRGGWR